MKCLIHPQKQSSLYRWIGWAPLQLFKQYICCWCWKASLHSSAAVFLSRSWELNQNSYSQRVKWSNKIFAHDVWWAAGTLGVGIHILLQVKWNNKNVDQMCGGPLALWATFIFCNESNEIARIVIMMCRGPLAHLGMFGCFLMAK